MSLSFVSIASAESTSVTPGTHAAGDTLIMFAFRASSNTVPTVPSGWVSRWTSSTSSLGSVVAYKVAASASETSGVWTNAESLICVVYNDDVNYLGVGGIIRNNGTSTTTIGYAGSIITGRTGTSPTIEAMHVAFGGCNRNSTDFESAPVGMTNRGSLAGAGALEITCHDTNAVSTSWSNVNRTNSESVSFHTYVFEIFDTGISKTASGGGGPLVGGRLAL